MTPLDLACPQCAAKAGKPCGWKISFRPEHEFCLGRNRLFAAMQWACPDCAAQPGEPCAGLTPGAIHDSRREAAEAMAAPLEDAQPVTDELVEGTGLI